MQNLSFATVEFDTQKQCDGLITNMDSAPHDPAEFFHVRIIVGTVAGLAIARLLNGLARFVQSQDRPVAYGVHVAWSFFLLILIVHFWWSEFALARVDRWTFEAYAFLIFYAALHFFTAAILYPDRLGVDESFERYFHQRRAWFFSLLALLFAVDMVDTAYKGTIYFHSLGPQYPIRQAALIALALLAIRVSDRRFHVAVVSVMFFLEIWWILSRYNILI